MLRESDFKKRLRIILRRLVPHCTKRVQTNASLHFWNYAAALSSPWFGFVLWKYVFFLSFCPLLTMAKTWVSLNPRGTCSLVCFCCDEGRGFRFFFPIRLTRLNRVRLERDCNTIAFPRSSSLHTVNARGSVISLPRGFSSWHIPLWRRVIKSLEGENSHSFFERISSL